MEVACGYCNLEYNLETGERGDRQEHLESLLCRLTGAEAALVVNNNAAAMLLAIHTLAKGGETVVSRGELIEVGGKFRLPDVIEESGARLREVGTTNRTYLEDYRNALNEETHLLLKVHTSNYQVLGFAQSVSIEELVALGKESNVPVLEDLGSGTLVDLQAYGLGAEPTVQSSVQQGVDVVCFSADKLLGGPQAGILVGKKKILEKMRINPLLRALRVDKFTTAALELHLRDYLQPERAMQEVAVLRMIAQPLEEVKLRANTLLDKMVKYPAVELSVGDSIAQIGGGAMPLEEIESAAVVLRPVTMSVNALEGKLRKLPVPVIGRIVNQQILLDLRTISPEMEDVFLEQWNTKMEFE
jgi:L-seryl-tRNA(Ser) seleniumtransferase